MFTLRKLSLPRFTRAFSAARKPLTAEETAIIKATVPILETGGEVLTKHFYGIMLKDHPVVLPYFNKAHQESGQQPRALANAVLMYAKNIEKMQNLGPLVNQIIHKHVSLDIKPEHYQVVGSCLLRAIREVLGPEVANDDVISAWASAYGQLADILIGLEAGLTDEKAKAAGGWKSGREFIVKEKIGESSVITSFVLEAADSKPVVAHQAGQYLGLHLTVNGDEVRRNYSISDVTNGNTYRISVKRAPGGVVSNHLHDNVKVGDKLELYPPSGEFTLQAAASTAKPLVFLTAGVGITPAMAMLQESLRNESTAQREVRFIHCVRSKEEQAFYDTVSDLAAKHSNLQQYNCYSKEQGRLNQKKLAEWLPADRDAEVFLLGTQAFMVDMKKALLNLGVPATQLHWEFFGPAASLDV